MSNAARGPSKAFPLRILRMRGSRSSINNCFSTTFETATKSTDRSSAVTVNILRTSRGSRSTYSGGTGNSGPTEPAFLSAGFMQRGKSTKVPLSLPLYCLEISFSTASFLTSCHVYAFPGKPGSKSPAESFTWREAVTL